MGQVPWYPQAEMGMTAADPETSTPSTQLIQGLTPKTELRLCTWAGSVGGRSQLKPFRVVKVDECTQGSGNQNEFLLRLCQWVSHITITYSQGTRPLPCLCISNSFIQRSQLQDLAPPSSCCCSRGKFVQLISREGCYLLTSLTSTGQTRMCDQCSCWRQQLIQRPLLNGTQLRLLWLGIPMSMLQCSCWALLQGTMRDLQD